MHACDQGETSVFKHLPVSWNAFEAKIVRATLLLARFSQEVLRFHQLGGFITLKEVAFVCMKVFIMLEHGRRHDDSQEVFRDSIVGRFMSDLLVPFSASASAKSLHTPPPPPQRG